jgi:flagellin-like protein
MLRDPASPGETAKAQSGIIGIAVTVAITMAVRRPMRCEILPKLMPAKMAPML